MSSIKKSTIDITQQILTNGPNILNTISDGVAILGISIGTGISSTGQLEFGGPILLGSLDLSTKLDVAATGLAAINYAVNGDSKKVQYQMYRLAAGGAFGKVFGKVVTTIKSFSPIRSPLIF